MAYLSFVRWGWTDHTSELEVANNLSCERVEDIERDRALLELQKLVHDEHAYGCGVQALTVRHDEVRRSIVLIDSD